MKSADVVDEPQVRGAPSPKPARRWDGFARSMGMLLLSVVALSLAFAPVKQFYLAWVGLVPFLCLVRQARSQRAAFLWGWASGIIFFLLNMWWLVFVTAPGTLALVVYLGLFWGLAAMVIRGCGLLERQKSWRFSFPLLAAALIAAVWTGLEWVRGSFSPFGWHGLPWLYLGYTQTPLVAMCQIADLAGAYGASFWVVAVNALLAMFWFDGLKLARLRTSFAVAAGFLLAIAAYGVFRISQNTGRPGPTVVVIQPNYPQSNTTGEKGAESDEIASFHIHETDVALAECARRGIKVDLVVWSETMMPPLNKATHDYTRGTEYGAFLENTAQQISGLAQKYGTGLLVGGSYADKWDWVAQADGTSAPMPAEQRNSAYFFERDGRMSPQRYDKIKLLAFGEFIPFKDAIPWLYRLLLALGPPDMKNFELTAGAPDATIVFSLDAAANAATRPTQTYRFVTPICFEDIVAPAVTGLLRGKGGEDAKRADFIVNITNDGWFKANERTQHLQAAIFRSIENRVPTARSVNTGVSGFIDPVGRVSDVVDAGTEGWSVHKLILDSRYPLYTRIGDVFAVICAVITLALTGWSIAAVWLARSRRVAGSPALGDPQLTRG